MSYTSVFHLSTLRTASERLGTVGEDVTAPSDARSFRTLSFALLVAVGYYAGTKIGFFLTPAQQPISTFWPPNAILLAALLLAPPRMWWGFLLAVLPAHLLVQLPAGVPVLTAVGWFIGNVGEALIGAAGIRYFRKGQPLFDSVHGLIIFLVFGVLVAPLATSFLDAAVVVVTGQAGNYGTLWVRRLFSNTIATLTLVPTIVLFGQSGLSRIRNAKLTRYVEAILLAFGIVIVSVLVFGHTDNNVPALIYAPLPLLLWASLRFGPEGLSASMLVVALISIWNVMHGRGPFLSTTVAENVLSLKVLLSLLALPLLWLAVVIAERRQTERALQNTRSRLIHAQEEERHRIARDLHDDIVQQLTLLGLDLEELRNQSDPSMKPRLDGLYDQVSSVAEATRTLSHNLYPFALEYLGLAPALSKLCRRIGEQSHIAINFAEEGFPSKDRLAAGISTCFYRVAQEALQNLVKHSHARTATVELRMRGGRALLRIADDGVGMDPDQASSKGIGLNSMSERVTALDGTFKITSASSKGTTIEASVPLDASL
jgi:signal transduction histidine kinase